MDSIKNKQQSEKVPASFVGYWKIGKWKYEIRSNGFFFVIDENVQYSLVDSGRTLIKKITRFSRLNGNPKELPGLWQREDDPNEDIEFRIDGTYISHLSVTAYFGEYSYDLENITTLEMRAEISVSGEMITFNPPGALPLSGTWSLVEPNLTIVLPGGTKVYTRA